MLFTASAAITAYAVNGNTPSAASMPDTPDMMSIGSLMPDDDMMHQGILLDGDSLKQAGLESKIQKAADLYKHLKWLKYENQPETEVYTTALDCYNVCVDAMKLAAKNSPRHGPLQEHPA